MKILAQGSSSLDKMIREAALAAPNLASRCLERLDAALFFELGKETFGGGRRFEAARLDRRTVATTVGVASFKRRHYIDRAMGRRCHPLDELIGLSPRSRVSDEMRPKVIEAASRMPHSKAAAWASPMAPTSKPTVARIIADVGVAAAGKPVEKGGRVRVRIDGKYVKMDGKPNKARLVAAAIFGGVYSHGGRNELERRALTSGTGLCEVADKINSALSEVFRLKEGDSVFPSGDLAPYIRDFGERLSFASRHVPDKWHVAHSLPADERPVAAGGAVGRLEEIEEAGDVTGLGEDALRVYGLWLKGKRLFGAWRDPECKGCCQEAMNPHR